MDALRLDHVSKSFDGTRAVDDLSLRVPQGSIFGFLGPNGSGKTTTLRMVLKIILPDSGHIRVLGTEMTDEERARIGYLPEERGLYRRMTVIDHLLFLGSVYGLSPTEARRRARAWLERFEAGDWERRKIEELSRGMQQKIQFVATILHDPELIILDEPFTGLDPVNVELLESVMLELHRRGRTIIFSTHMMEKVEKTCDSICLIDKGRLLLAGELATIRQRYGGNTVRVDYRGDLGQLEDSPLVERYDDHGSYAEIKLTEPDAGPALLREVSQKVDVLRFEISEASLNDIFIAVVRGRGHGPEE
jgi:ABC-2 type transport system ATP-binding protein